MSDVYRLVLEDLDGEEIWAGALTITDKDPSGRSGMMNLYYPLGQVAMMGKVKEAILEWEKGLAALAKERGYPDRGLIRSLFNRGDTRGK